MARHIAEAFPCVSAVVFNSSPVTLAYRLNPRITGGYIIDIVENHDPLRTVTEIFRLAIRSAGALLQLGKFIDDQTVDIFPSFDDSDSHKNYYKFSALNMSELPDGSDHSLSPFAVSMSRMVADCITNNNCSINKDRLAFKAAQLYCNSDWAKYKNGDIDDACPPPYRHGIQIGDLSKINYP